MSEKTFFLFVYITLGFSILPILLISILYLLGKKCDRDLYLISFIEFSTFVSNFLLYNTGLGHLKIQYTIYSILEISIWIYILQHKFLTNKQGYLIIFSSTLILLLLYQTNQLFHFELISRILQFILGLKILLKNFDFEKTNKNQFLSHNFYLSIGLLIYSFFSINLYLFQDLLVKMKLSSFSFATTSHQFAAIIYFSLLSISIWKSQKI